MAIFYLQLYTKYSWYLWYLAVVCHNLTIYFSASCQSRALNTLLAHQDYVTTQWGLDWISKASLTFNLSFYYLLKMCCNRTLHQKHKHPKRKHFQLNPSSIFSTWHLTETDVTSHLMLISQQPAIIPKITRYPSKKSYHFQPNPFNKCWMSSPVVWNHPSDLIGFCPKQTAVLWQLWQLGQLFHDSCHSFSWQLGQPFQNSCDS